MSDPQVEPAQRFEVRVTADSHFAWLRTRLAVERTMMAYMRTAVSLIAFGFTIFQFLQRYHESVSRDVRFPYAAWYLGLALIFCGVLAAAVSLWEYRRMIDYIRTGPFAAVAAAASEQRRTPLDAITGVLILIGIFAFFAVLLDVK
jgi:putative membrane protein